MKAAVVAFVIDRAAELLFVIAVLWLLSPILFGQGAL